MFYKTEAGCKFGDKRAFTHCRVEEQPSTKGQHRMVTKVQWLCRKKNRIWVVYFRTWSRRSLHRFYGRRQPCGNQSDVFDSLKPCFAMPRFETKIHRSTKFAQANLISDTRTHQNLRIGLRRRQNGKSIVLAKQRGRRHRTPQNYRRKRELHSSR